MVHWVHGAGPRVHHTLIKWGPSRRWSMVLILFHKLLRPLLILADDRETNDCGWARKGSGGVRAPRRWFHWSITGDRRPTTPVHGFQWCFFLQDQGGAMRLVCSPRGSGGQWWRLAMMVWLGQGLLSMRVTSGDSTSGGGGPWRGSRGGRLSSGHGVPVQRRRREELGLKAFGWSKTTMALDY
jgi:hypothetical protein